MRGSVLEVSSEPFSEKVCHPSRGPLILRPQQCRAPLVLAPSVVPRSDERSITATWAVATSLAVELQVEMSASMIPNRLAPTWASTRAVQFGPWDMALPWNIGRPW